VRPLDRGARVASIVASTLLVLAPVSGCGAAQTPKKTATPVREKILNEAELNRALLDADSVGTGFVAERFGWDVNPDGWPGCLAPLDGITYFSTPTRESLVGIHADTDQSFPVVLSTVAAFSTDKEAEVALPALRDKLADCTRVDEADDDGGRFVLRVTHDDAQRAGKVDDQVNVFATGTMRVAGGELPISFGFSVVRVANNVALTGFLTSRSGSVATEAAEVAKAALARLASVAAGKEVPDGPSLGFEPYEGDLGPGTAA
jgi:hypothetical protein